MEGLLASLGEGIQDAEEETFNVFLRTAALPDLGMLDPRAKELELSIAGREFTIKQSPGLLQSEQKQGTTGAAVWQTSVRVAEWLASPGNVLFKQGVLNPNSSVLELGAGTSGIVAGALAPRVGEVVATDQKHLLRLLRANIDANATHSPRQQPRKASKGRLQASDLKVLALDWEEDDIPKQLIYNGLGNGVDVVLACDCVYNYALIQPFVQTCAAICGLRRRTADEGKDEYRPSVCIVAQQLRQSEVFEQWMVDFTRLFRLWHVPDELLTEGLKEGSGYSVHLGLLK